MRLRGADIVVRALARAGTRYVFTLSGNHVMPVFDAALDAKLPLVHVRHEAAAVHMADAWGRLTGETGVALVRPLDLLPVRYDRVAEGFGAHGECVERLPAPVFRRQDA